MEEKSDYKQIVWAGITIAGIILGVLLVIYIIHQLVALILLVLFAVVITTGIDPLVVRLQRLTQKWWEMSRAQATLIIILTMLLTILSISSFLLVTAVNESLKFAENAWPTLIHELEKWSGQKQYLPDPAQLFDKLSTQSGQIFEYLFTTTRAVFGVLGGVFTGIILLVLTYFFTSNKEDIVYLLVQFIPAKYQLRSRAVAHLAAMKMGGWIRGQFTIAGIMLVTISMGMTALRIDYPILIGLVGGIGEFIPMVGAYGAFWVALAIMLVTHAPAWQLISVIVFFVILTQIDNYVLAPKVMEKNVDMPPITSILAILFGVGLLGFAGALVAIPIAAGVRVVMYEVIFPLIQGKTREQIDAESPRDRRRRMREKKRAARKKGSESGVKG
ncbi:MAG: AI-2E family transporter [bacterium]